MEYRRLIISSVIISIIAAIVNEFVFAASTVVTNDAILDGTLNVLITIQKYSWPFVTLLMIFALYKYFVTGSEVLTDKVVGQRMVVGIVIFMVVVQCLPLAYAFLIV